MDKKLDRFNSSCGLRELLPTIWLSLIPLVSMSVSPTVPAFAIQHRPSAGMTTVWKGPNGEILTFGDDEEVREFLRTAEVIDIEEIPEGVTEPKRVLLEKNGIRMRGIFRDVDISKSVGPGMEGRSRLNFRDCCLFEVAAYELARMLRLNNIPPAVRREVRGRKGTLQLWVEGTFTEANRLKKGREPPSPWHHAMQHQIMKLFDNLIYNEDRHAGNVLYDENWKLWMIDHTRSFRMDKYLPKPEEIKVCETALWEKLQTLDEGTLRERLKDLLKKKELEALLVRKKLLVEHLKKLIERNGEKKVLFKYFAPRRVSP